jgi:hypothetical protein
MSKLTEPEQKLLDTFTLWEGEQFAAKRLTYAEASAFLPLLRRKHGLQDWYDDIVSEVSGDTPEARHLGLCHFPTTTIYLTKFCLENRTVRQVKETILHEIAHALSGDAKHSEAWVAKARELGVSPEEIERTLRDDLRDCIVTNDPTPIATATEPKSVQRSEQS